MSFINQQNKDSMMCDIRLGSFCSFVFRCWQIMLWKERGAGGEVLTPATHLFALNFHKSEVATYLIDVKSQNE